MVNQGNRCSRKKRHRQARFNNRVHGKMGSLMIQSGLFGGAYLETLSSKQLLGLKKNRVSTSASLLC